MSIKESVRINLKGVSSVTIDPEVLAEYKTTIEDLEQKLSKAKWDLEMAYGNLEGARKRDYDLSKRYQKLYWETQHYKFWRQSL